MSTNQKEKTLKVNEGLGLRQLASLAPGVSTSQAVDLMNQKSRFLQQFYEYNTWHDKYKGNRKRSAAFCNLNYPTHMCNEAEYITRNGYVFEFLEK